MVLELKSFDHPQGMYTMNLPEFKNSNTKKVAYVTVCPCQLLYVGVSMRAVNIIRHRSCIQNKNMEAPSVSHFVGRGYTADDLQFCIISKYIPYLYNHNDAQKCCCAKRQPGSLN